MLAIVCISDFQIGKFAPVGPGWRLIPAVNSTHYARYAQRDMWAEM
jgi:hypothetical protein